MTPEAYCADEVRRRDRDRYLTALFAPEPARTSLLALYAFNIEIARVRESVSEPLLGEIRLQFWRDAVAEIFEAEPRRHQVALALREAVRRHGLSRAHFDRLIEARRRDLDDEPPADAEDLEAYATATTAPLMHLALAALGAEGTVAAPVVDGIGVAWALGGLLRAVPFMAAQGRVMLPLTWLGEAGIGAAEVRDGRSSDALAAVVERVAERARMRLAAARAAGRITTRARPALLVAGLAARDLARLRDARHDPFSVRLQRPEPLARQLRVTRMALTGRF